jgi:hypothetical protein
MFLRDKYHIIVGIKVGIKVEFKELQLVSTTNPTKLLFIMEIKYIFLEIVLQAMEDDYDICIFFILITIYINK